MTSILLESRRPDGSTSLAVHCGDPAADTVFPFTGVEMIRVWEDGSLAAFNAAGKVTIVVRPGFWWGFLWL